MKKIKIILMITILITALISKTEATVDTIDRSKFNYEVLKTTMNGSILTIEGWGFINENQNLHGTSTHSFTIELHNKGVIRQYAASITNHNLSDIMKYTGYPNCKDSDYYRNNCNYTFNNVGFRAQIDVSDLPPDQSYSVYLLMHTKQTNKSFRAPLYYAQNQPLVYKSNNRTVSLTSNFKQMNFNIYYHTLRTSTQPQPANGIYHLRLLSNCSSSYENYAFYAQGAQFENILGVSYYQGVIPYYKVKVKDAGCYDARRRVKEGGVDGIIAHIPSTYVSYTGKPMTIDIVEHRAPVISANDHMIEQYSNYNPLDFALANDKEEGDISHKINVFSNTVNPSIPGIYQSCYRVINKYNLMAEKCVKVTVMKLPVRIRYINNKSLDHASLSIWSFSKLKSLLRP